MSRRPTCVMAFLAAAFALTCVAALASAQAPRSADPRALDDPRVKRCLFLGLRRQDPALDPLTSHADQAAAILDFNKVMDAVAECRAALANLPAEPRVIIAHYNAIEAFNLLLFGLKEFPATDEAAVSTARRLAASPQAFIAKMANFFLGSAYEYGIGVTADKGEAIRWYRAAANAGDATAKRELARLEAATAPK